MLQRILHKKWMVASLLIGNILLIAIAVSHPMYQNASRNRMLTDEFTNYLDDHNSFPMIIEGTGHIRKNAGKTETKKIRQFCTTVSERFELPEMARVCYRNLVLSTATSTTVHDGSLGSAKMAVSSLNDLEQHSTILSGRMYSSSVGEDGYYEAVITQSAMITLNLLVGEELEFENLILNDGAGETLKVRIVGVFTNSDANDLYWVRTPDYYEQQIFIDPVLFEECFMDKSFLKYQVNEVWTVLLDYTKLRPEQVDDILGYSKDMVTAYKTVYSSIEEPDYIALLDDYSVEEKQISVTLSILQVPVIVLLCAFIFMISRQMLEMEDNEIALLKSRGASRLQIIRLYLYQSAFLAGVSLLVGLPLGSIICRVLGSATAFLEFGRVRNLVVEYNGEVFLYGAGAAVASMLMTLLPVFKKDKSNIVAVKRRKQRQSKPFWQKIYLDFVILGVSLYGLYNFEQQQDEMLLRVLSGKPLDPLLFLSSSLFILGAGLIAFRLHGILIRFIYTVGKKFWKPAEYTSFLQIIRTGNKQAFIMVFLVLTVAFGLFNTTVARTIIANAENNSEYMSGADIVMTEYWKNNASYAILNPDVEISFTEPEFAKYGQLNASGIAKVFRSDNTTTTISKKDYTGTLYAIDTDDFGRTTNLDDDLLKYDYYDYLNVLSRNASAVLLSANYRDKLGVKVGDKITYSWDSNYCVGKTTATVYGFFDYWPSYSPTGITIGKDGNSIREDNYLIVAHLSTIQEASGIFPYEIWINMNGDTSEFYEFIERENVKVTSVSDATKDKAEISRQPLFQGTNGILTMSFITILLICSIGYVIYWTLSIRSRELLFGIFRAMGMSKREVVTMLVNEQVFTGLFGIIFGLLIGWVASVLYVPIIQIAYSASDRVLPLELITRAGDVTRLVVIVLAVFIICLGILINQVFRMKISQALKLGED